MHAAKWAAPPSGRSSRATAVTTTKRRPIAAAASAMRAGSLRVGRPPGPARGDVAEAAPAGAGVAGDHEGGRPARPALADVRAGGLLADGHELGGAHQGLGADEPAREGVLRDHPARQAARGRRAGPARPASTSTRSQRLGRRRRPPASPPSSTSGIQPCGAGGGDLGAGRDRRGSRPPGIRARRSCRHGSGPVRSPTEWSSPIAPSARSSPPAASSSIRSTSRCCSRRRSTCGSTRDFRVFHNNRRTYIDVREAERRPDRGRDDPRGRGVHPPPRRVRARLDGRARGAARRPGGPPGGQVEPRPARAADPLDGRATSTRASTARSRSSSPTWRACRSRSTRAWPSGRSRSSR